MTGLDREPAVSVVIPVYNTAPYICQCLGSVLGQSLSDLEVICVDDGSTDESADILAAYADKDSRLTVITQTNAGPGAARNAGLERAAGRYIIFLDSDDWFEPDFLERMVNRAEDTGADVCICRAVEFDTHTGRDRPSDWMLKTAYLSGGGVFAPTDVAAHLFQFTYGMPWDKLYRREFVLDTGIRFPPFYNSEDLAFVFPTLVSAERIAIVDSKLIHHRVNRRSSVSNTRETQPQAPYDAFRIVKTYLEENGLMPKFEKSFMNWAMEFLVWHLSNMDNGSVRRQYFKALRQEWLPEMKFSAHPVSYYENKADYSKYLLAKYAPYPIFCATVSLYKTGKRLALK